LNSYNELLRNYFTNPLNLEKSVNLISKKVIEKKSIFIIGNGGSASTAEHFATDLLFIKFNEIKNKIKVIALSSNSASLTAIANDIGFDKVFSHQLNRFAEEGDLCIFISASGNSENLTEAMKICKEQKIETIAIVGFDGGKLKLSADQVLHFETEIGRYAEVEDVHLSICHQISLLVRNKLLVS
jgi:D-sedoheptulose 7-phosphate isomerase